MLELVRREVQLRLEIARHELQCLMDDGADADQVDAKLWECQELLARQEALERRVMAITEAAGRIRA